MPASITPATVPFGRCADALRYGALTPIATFGMQDAVGF